MVQHQDNRAEFQAAMRAALGPDARLYAIVARERFAVRHGPLTLAECDELIEWGEEEHVPVMITADCGALPDRALLASLFGETREARAKLRDQPNAAARQYLSALRVLCEKVAGVLITQGPSPSGVDNLRELREAWKPLEAVWETLAPALEPNRPHPPPPKPRRAARRDPIEHDPSCASIVSFDAGKCDCSRSGDHG